MKDHVCERSFGRITAADLRRLATLAQGYFDDLFDRRPSVSGKFRRRLLLMALCQGAALHYVDRSHGIKDFDVWAFFRALPNVQFPNRGTHGRRDFGPSRFGRQPGDKGYQGRRVDILGRSIDVRRGENKAAALRRYLAKGKRGSTPWHLAQRPVIAIYPEAILGRQLWPPSSVRNSRRARSVSISRSIR
jgi:hypothetical protein